MKRCVIYFFRCYFVYDFVVGVRDFVTGLSKISTTRVMIKCSQCLLLRACSSYGCFILGATRLSNKLLEQGYVKEIVIEEVLWSIRGSYQTI